MRIAFLTTRLGKPSYRFRVEQFLPFLENEGVGCDVFVIPRSVFSRRRLFRSLRGYDVVFLQKKLLRLPDRRFIRSAARRLVYDVDDAVMYACKGDRPVLSPRRRRLFRSTVRMSDAVLAGNDYLCRWAADYGANVVSFRTVVDTERYAMRAPSGRKDMVIGWTGSSSTNRYLEIIAPAVAALAGRHDLTLRVVSDARPDVVARLSEKMKVEFIPWTAESETAILHSFDVGLMPLPDNDFTRGKCALKALLYMSCGVPAICSPVGSAARIITDGEDGFLAASPDEWRTKIERLIMDHELRERIAGKARKTVERGYSAAGSAPRLLEIFRGLCMRVTET